MNEYKGKFSQNKSTSTPKPRRKKKNKFKRAIRKFFQNRNVQLILGIFICMLIFRGCQYVDDKAKFTELMETQKTEIVTEYETKIADLQLAHQNELEEIRAEYENLTPEELLRQEAEYIAKVLYGTARNNSERDKRTVVWCILNRVDSSGYPNTVQGVCQQPSQWMGYSDDNPILNELFDIAMKELETWHNNYRPVSKDYVYMAWSSKEIVLRDTYNKEDNTQHWQAG